MLKIFFLFLLISFQQNLFAQNSTIKILNASQQSWSGGVAGAQGEKFQLEIQTNKNFVPDTFHLSGYAIPIRIYPRNAYSDYNCTKVVKGNTVTYMLNLNFSFPNPYFRNIEGNEADFPKAKKYKCNYELIFKNNQSLCISKYEILPPLAYP